MAGVCDILVVVRSGSAVDFGAHDCNRLLIDGGCIPLFDHGKVRLTLLVPLSGLPAFLAQEVSGGGHRIRLIVQIHAAVAIAVNAITQCVARQELGMAQLTVLGTFVLEVIEPRSTSISAPIAWGVKNADRRQSYASVVMADTTAEPPMKPPKPVSMPWMASSTPAGTPYCCSSDE